MDACSIKGLTLTEEEVHIPNYGEVVYISVQLFRCLIL